MGKPSPLAIGNRIADRKCRQRYKKQRVNHGYSFWDLADMDCYLLELIPSMLESMVKCKDTTPSDMTEQEWHDWLVGTAQKFRAILPISEDWDAWLKDSDAQREVLNKALKDAFDALQEHFFSLWI